MSRGRAYFSGWLGRCAGVTLRDAEDRARGERRVVLPRSESRQWAAEGLPRRRRLRRLHRADEAGRPTDCLNLVHEPLTERELAAMGRSVNRGTPLGEERCVGRVAATLGLRHALPPAADQVKNLKSSLSLFCSSFVRRTGAWCDRIRAGICIEQVGGSEARTGR